MTVTSVLIAGGAGFVGSHLTRHILDRTAAHVVVLDSLKVAANVANLIELDEASYEFVRGDITDRVLLNQLFETHRFDAVVNLAAESYADRSIIDPGIFVTTNVVGTQTLLDAARSAWRVGDSDGHRADYRANVRFVQVSTAEVYGDGAPPSGFDEGCQLSPTTPFAASKASADLIVQSYHRSLRFPCNVIRCSVNYGPLQFPEKLVPKVIDYWSTGRRLPVYGDGRQTRDWVHVTDSCEAICSVLDRGADGEVYNVGGPAELTNLELITQVLERVGGSLVKAEHVRDRPGHARRVVLDSTKIFTDLGWKPTLSAGDGVDSTVDWYLMNPEWLRRITSGAYRQDGQVFLERGS